MRRKKRRSLLNSRERERERERKKEKKKVKLMMMSCRKSRVLYELLFYAQLTKCTLSLSLLREVEKERREREEENDKDFLHPSIFSSTRYVFIPVQILLSLSLSSFSLSLSLFGSQRKEGKKDAVSQSLKIFVIIFLSLILASSFGIFIERERGRRKKRGVLSPHSSPSGQSSPLLCVNKNT